MFILFFVVVIKNKISQPQTKQTFCVIERNRRHLLVLTFLKEL